MAAHKKYREWNPADYARQPVTPADILPEDDLVFFLIDLVPRLDLDPIYAHYERETRGAPPFDVAMMTTVLFYSYSVGVFSSRKIAAACERNVAFLAIVGQQRPDFRCISDFRKIHLDALSDLFLEVLQIAGQLGMVKLGNLSLDGSKVRANASRHKAMSYGYMQKEVQRLREEIKGLLQAAQQTDGEEDAALGSRRGDELPDELARRQSRLAAIEQAMARLEQEAEEKAEEKRRQREQADAERAARGEKRRGREPKPISSQPEAKAQTSFTDPDAKIMKTSNKGFDYCYNGQAMVDEDQQIIVAAEVTPAANDKQQATPLAQQTLENLQTAGIEVPQQADGSESPLPMSADTGYFSEENVTDLESQGFDPYIATGRQKHNQSRLVPQPAADENRASENKVPSEEVVDQDAASDDVTTATTESGDAALGETATAKERMAHKLRTPAGRARYAKRKHIVEPVFGQMKQARGFRQFLLRGLKKVRGEWKLVCLTHNLLKIWRYQLALN